MFTYCTSWITRKFHQKKGKTTTIAQCLGESSGSVGIGLYSPSGDRGYRSPPRRRSVRPRSSRGLRGTQAAHHVLPKFQGTLVLSPAFNIRLLIPAPSNRPNTVSKKSVTTSWSLGESLWKLASISPSLPVAVSGLVSPIVAPAQMGRFWFKHHCFVHERQGFDGLSGMCKCNIL